MKEAQLKLGRLVQCFCSLCNTNQQGFQWTLPRTKGKHVLYEKTTRDRQERDIDVIQQKLSFTSINDDGMVKKRKRKPAFRISMTLQRKLNKIGYNETLIVLKEFTVTSSSTSAAPLAANSQGNIPPVNDYY